jgi:TRAP-type mannitol/chloroaromatic compound transport system permease large subunit
VTEFLPAIMVGVFTVLIMLGYPVMLERSGLAEDLLETMALVFGRLPGASPSRWSWWGTSSRPPPPSWARP